MCLAQLLLVGVAFNKIVFHPREQVLYADYDGGKNYFTPYSYVSGLGAPAAGAHPLKVYGQHYPFGEYVFFTDNTPLAALPMRLAAKLGAPMPAGGVAGLTLFFLALTWLTAPLVYVLLRELAVAPGLSAAFALTTPWVAKQLWHLSIGSPNLGLTALTIALLLLLLTIWRDARPWRPWLIAGAFIGITGWIHLYYVIIYGAALALFALALLARDGLRGDWRALAVDWPATWRSAGRALASGLLALAIIYVPMVLIDSELPNRTGTNLGFDFEAWKLDLRSLITPYPELRSRFVVSYREPIFGERSGYLGLWFLYAVLLLLVERLVRGRRGLLRQLHAQAPRGFLSALLFVGTLCFFASLGTHYQNPGNDYRWRVILNPFYLLVDLFPALEQFRVTARFFFVTQWAWSIPVIVAIDRRWRAAASDFRLARWLTRAAIVAVVACAGIDARDWIRARNRAYHPNPMGVAATAPLLDDLAAIDELDLRRFQALLVAPFYHVGSEVAGLVADPEWHQERDTWSLLAATRLPMLNAVTSRTPPAQARQLFGFVATGHAPDTLAALLDARDILLAVHVPSVEALAAGAYPTPEHEPAHSIAPRSLELRGRPGVDSLGRVGNFVLYRMPLRRQPPAAE